jgi:Flp pilus assembly protein TadG
MDMSLIQKFARNCNGGVAVYFAAALVPLMLGAGVAIDMVQVNASTTVLQNAVDAAALGGASSGETDKAKIEKVVKSYLTANKAGAVLETITDFDVKLDENNNTLSVTVSGQRPTSLMHLAGIDKVDIFARAVVNLPSDGLEVAMVLDVTGSMNADGRLPALKSAAKDFVDTMMEAKDNGAYVRVGVVPFSEYVNVGLSRRNESWIDVPADTSVTQPQVCSIQYPHRQWTNCTEVQKTGYNDGVPYTYTSYENCTVVDGQAENVCHTPVQTSKWYGCVGSRNNPLDEQIGKVSTRYPGLMNITCNDEIQTLTDDGTKLKSKINNLAASGNTYVPTGLLWGWNMVDGSDPLDEAKSAAEIKAKGGTKAIVLMTDGDNTISATYPTHQGSDGDTADKKVTELCKNIKKDDIVIYTISFMVTDADSITMLEKCASDPSKAFSADNAAQLSQAFGDISESLMAMRLSK